VIIREWSAIADADGFAAYRTHVLEVVYPVLAQTAGFCGFELLSGDPDEEGLMTILVQTRWTSADSQETIRRVRSLNPQRATSCAPSPTLPGISTFERTTRRSEAAARPGSILPQIDPGHTRTVTPNDEAQLTAAADHYPA
jgi:hypothetical protein